MSHNTSITAAMNSHTDCLDRFANTLEESRQEDSRIDTYRVKWMQRWINGEKIWTNEWMAKYTYT
jgi:hypothetical protein